MGKVYEETCFSFLQRKLLFFKQVLPDYFALECAVVHIVMSTPRQQMAVTLHCTLALSKVLEHQEFVLFTEGGSHELCGRVGGVTCMETNSRESTT